MLKIRNADERGHLNFGWLDAKHTFSFGSYHDPAHMGFRSLRVINNDLISGGGGFDTHPHKDMEIMTFILEGSLEHRDTMGNHSIIKPGEIQIMSAGSGVFHSEHNPSETESTKLYQIWITPNKKGVEPRYEQFSYLDRVKENDFIDLVTPEGGERIPMIYQDAIIKLGSFKKDKSSVLKLNDKKGYWIQVLKGSFKVNNESIKAEDGLSIENLGELRIQSVESGEVLLFELG